MKLKAGKQQKKKSMNQIAGSLKRSLKLKNYSKLIIKKITNT